MVTEEFFRGICRRGLRFLTIAILYENLVLFHLAKSAINLFHLSVKKNSFNFFSFYVLLL